MKQNYIHMFMIIPSKYSVSSFIGYLKSKSTLIRFNRHANMKYKYGNKKFWSKGYYCVTVGYNEEAVKNYIRNQLQEDKLSNQVSMKEFINPFIGKKSNKKKNPLRGKM